MSFFGIHNHTAQDSNLRLRDSINKIEDMIDYAHELGHKGIVFTGHESITSHLDALRYYNSKKELNDWQDFKVGLGNEIYLCNENVNAENIGHNRYPHFILVALDELGHKAVRELSTKAWTQNAFMHVMYRVPTYYSDLEEVLEQYKGHLIGSSACFRKGTQIETKQGWKNIENIQKGDFVINRYGEWEEVLEPTTRYYQGKGYELSLSGHDRSIVCTANHQFLTITGNRKKPKWVEAKDLFVKRSSMKDIMLLPCKKYDYTQSIVISKEEYVNCLFKDELKLGRKRINLPKNIILSSELMRLFGLFLGDGSISLKKSPCINFTFNEAEFEYFYQSFVKEAGRQLNIQWSITKRPEHHRVDITSGSVELVELFYYLFGDNKANSKYIPKRLRISEELDYELVFGYLLADGHFRIRSGNKRVTCPTGEFVSASISYNLTKDIYAILSNMGITVNIGYKKGYVDKQGTNHQDSWYIEGSNYTLGSVNKKRVYNHEEVVKLFSQAIEIKKTDYIIIDGIKYRKIRIKEKKEIQLYEQVFCLNNTTHSFKCENVIVHNCLGGALPNRILEYKAAPKETIWGSCIAWIEYMNEIFGQGYFFLELQPGETEEQIYVNKQLIKLSEQTKTPYIITTDSHYLKKGDRTIHKTYLNAEDGDREVDDFYATTYIMSEEEIHDYMDNYLGSEVVQQGINNTMLIYDMIQDYQLTKDLDIPYIPLNTNEPDKNLYVKYKNNIELLNEFIKSEYDSDRHLVREIISYIDTDLYYQTEEAYSKINECLLYIKDSSEKMKVRWSAYLLQVADYVNIAWEAGSLVGAGRGSGVGFCLLHILGITQINPLREKTQTFPWRFLNPERASVLDIDIDIMSSKRDTVIQALKDTYGEDRVSKVMTLSTEKSKSAILTAARGLGIDNDTASYIASLVVFDRGNPRSLKQMYYGDDDNPPVAEFVREMDARPELWTTAQKIEGLVCGVGSHAGGVIIVDKPFTDSTALMRTKSGDVITQFDLHMCEDCSLIKIDLLCIDALDKIYETLMLLLKDGVIEWQGSLKKTYEKYIGVYTLERSNEDMWEMLWEHKVLSFFQMEKESGKQAIALSKPHSIDDLATLNSVLRLMAQEKGAESPLQKYARFKTNIQEWYDEMIAYGLTTEEQDILKEIIGVSCGICEAQEYLVLLTQHPKIGGFSLAWGDRLRKAVAKKKPKDFLQLEEEFFINAKEKGLSKNLVNYVWNVLISTQRGYGFNKSHTLAYSIIGGQELNLCYKFNPIYWNTSNLIVDSGSLDEESNDSTNYGKMAVAIASVQKEGVSVNLPVINEADFGFKPDTENDRIIFGLKGINGINTDISQMIIQNRPYTSIEDFCTRLIDTKLVKNSQMIKLIKGGCFTELHNKDRKVTMEWYLRNYVFEPCNGLTMQQFNKMKELDFIPGALELPLRMINFKNYVLDDEGLYEKHIDEGKKIPKRGYHDGYYILDNNSQPFFKQYFTEDSVVDIKGEYYIVSEKKFTKEVDSYIQPLKDWMSKETTLEAYNQRLFKELWKKHAEGSISHWNMEALCYYDGEHELEHINEKLYGIVNFFDLPEEPEPYEWYTRYINGEPKSIPKYKISRIAGVVLNSDNSHHLVTILTKYGVVNVKHNKGQYAFYNKTISEVGEDGKKKRLEESWFKRGNLIIISGYRRDDQFRPLVYADTIYKHTVNLINEVYEDGTILVQSERTKTETI